MTDNLEIVPAGAAVSQNEIVVLDPSHPLMSRFQVALKKQLSTQKEKLDQELREANDSLRRFKQEREDVGVLLYGAQQELAKQQTELEICSDVLSEKKQLRETADQDLGAQRQVFEHANEEYYHKQQQNSQLQSQIEDMGRKIIYMEEAKEEVTSNVRTLNRASNKAGAELAAAELDKRRQDIFVDRLTQRVEVLQDEKTKYEAQLVVQQNETGAYREMLTEAKTEIEEIELDKKRLMQQWDSSIISMRKRDEFYTDKNTELRKVKEEHQSTEMEVISLKKTILSTQQENERLTNQYGRIENEVTQTKRKAADCQTKKDATLAQYSELLAVFNSTEADLKKREIERTDVESALNVVKREIEKEHNSCKNVENEIDQHIQDKRTSSQASQALHREIARVREKRRNLEAELAKTDNNMVRDALECSVVRARNNLLENTCKQNSAEIREVNEQINKSENNITRLRSKIERNQTTIDTKNKKLEQLVQNSGGEDLGPLEIQANSLKKSLEEITQEIVEQEQFWLRKQYELVKVSKDKATKATDLDSVKKQFTIYLQRKLRIEREIEQREKDRRETLRSIRNMQNDMLKLNTLLNKERAEENDLEQGNILAENEFVQELRQAEMSMIELEKGRDSLYTENQKLTRSLLEAERQVMLWEGKTQLAKETRDAVDKEVGQGEIKQMKSEIHRMEVRFSQLMKEQETLMRESEKCIEQRGSISIRAEARAKNDKHKNDLNKIGFERQMNEKKRVIKKMYATADELDAQIGHSSQEQQILTNDLSEAQLKTGQINNKLDRTKNDLQQRHDEKAGNVVQLSTKQELLKNMQSIQAGKLRLISKSIEQTKELLNAEREKAQNLNNICDQLSQDFPQIGASFRSVGRTLDSAISEGGSALGRHAQPE